MDKRREEKTTLQYMGVRQTRSITLRKEDVNNPLYPALWEQILESLEVPLYAKQVTMYVRMVTIDE